MQLQEGVRIKTARTSLHRWGESHLTEHAEMTSPQPTRRQLHREALNAVDNRATQDRGLKGEAGVKHRASEIQE